jgi:hypothetical protein
MGCMPFFMVYGAKVVLPIVLNYVAPRIVAKEYLEDAMDQLEEAHNVALAQSAKY